MLPCPILRVNMWAKYKASNGFTIVELLIVIVVIGILAAITIVAYNGIQDRAKNTKIKNDLAQIQKAVTLARINKDIFLIGIYANGAPEGGCISKASGTDLAALPRSTDSCWTAYDAFLNSISTASEVNIRGLVDPWGRPYYVNPNESENQTTHLCMNDQIGTYNQPFTPGTTNVVLIPLYKTSC